MEAEKEINVLRGEPVQIVVGNKEETVLRLSIDDQITVMDLITAQPGTDINNKFVIDRMVKVIALCMKRDVQKDEFFSLAQIVAANNKLWAQNEFDFLLQEVGKVKLKAS